MGSGKDLSKFTPAVIDALFVRDGGRCAKCGRQWDQDHGRGLMWSVHHRAPRQMGGSRNLEWVGNVSNALILCGHGTLGCHGDVEKFRADSRQAGFIVSRHGIRKSHEVPIKHAVHGWVLLTREGGVTPCEPDE